MDELHKVSILIPCHNSERTIARCMDSILSQDYQNLEIICIDDGSKDNTAKMLESYAEEHDTITLIRNERWLGTMASRIKGIMCATGEYICFIDSDDYVDRDYVESLLNVLIASGADISFSNAYLMDGGNVDPLPPPFEGMILSEKYRRMFANSHGEIIQWYVLWGKMFRAELLRNAIPDLEEYSDITMCEDLIISARISRDVECIISTEKPTYNYCINKTEGVTSSPTTYRTNSKYIDDVSKALCAVARWLELDEDPRERWSERYQHIWRHRIDKAPMNRILKLILRIKIKYRLSYLRHPRNS